MKDIKNFDPESAAIFSSSKIKGLAYLMSNFNRHSSNREEEQSAWCGISLILEDIANEVSEIGEALETQRRTSKNNA